MTEKRRPWWMRKRCACGCGQTPDIREEIAFVYAADHRREALEALMRQMLPSKPEPAVADAPVLKRLEEIEYRRPGSTHADVRFLLDLTRALLESQGDLLPLASTAISYYVNKHGECGCYTAACKACAPWRQKANAAQDALSRAEKVRKGEV